MSDLLNSASLVMIPSGYKEDVVYSQIPTDGSGDLAFTRASNGTRINSAGLVEVVPWNLLEYSEDFSNGAWTQSAVTITSNSTTAPNGTTTADTIAFSSGGYVGQTFTNNGLMTIFVYAKYIGTQWLCIENFNQQDKAGWFDIQNGVLGATAYGATNSIENVGNGWYKCVVTMTATDAASSTYAIFSVNGNSSFTRSGSAYLWGGQLNIGSTAKPYFPTTDRLNVPRLTYQNGGGGCPSLLLEKQSTNVVTYSEQFDNAAWSKLDSGSGSTTPVVTANYATSPDGTQNADRLQCTLGSSGYSLIQQAPTLSGTHTGSIWVKSNTGANQNIYFRVSTNTTAYVVTPEWQRITITEGNGDYLTIGLRDQTGYTNYSCDILIWGAQLEASSYATSYIPTTSSSATRVADACFKTGISSLIGQSEGTILLDCVILTTDSQDLLSVRPGGTSALAIGTASNLILGYVLEGATVISMSFANYAINTRYKIALAYKNGDCALYVNGTQADTDSTAFTFSTALSSLYLGQSQYFGKASFQQNETVTFPTRLSNSELQALTSL